jgi:hypothetical protein
VAKKRAYLVKLWRELERAQGVPIPAALRSFLAVQHARVLAERPPRELVVRAMLATLANLEAHGLWPADDLRPLARRDLPRSARRDGRWLLWRELRKRRAELLGDPPDEPPWTVIGFGRHRAAGTIVYTFDRRLPDKTVAGALKRELPRLRARGWMRATRPLSARQLALLRYVCLESNPTASWRQRARGWRDSRFCKAHPKWGKPYRGKSGARRFKNDFHSAEASLAGSEGQLGLHYDLRVRERILTLRRTAVDAGPVLAEDAGTPLPEITTWRRVDPTKTEALRAQFAAAAEIEALVAQAKAGDDAAADEALALCLRWRPAAIDELKARLGRVGDNRQDPDEPGDVE